MSASRCTLASLVAFLALPTNNDSPSTWAQAPDAGKPAVVEHVTEKPKRGDGALGTTFYKPNAAEEPHFKKLGRDELTTGGLAGDYDITKKDQVHVGWFGIVREVKEDKEHDQTVLLVEHKYFDGLTDTHILALSFNGAGDFQATLPGIGHQIERLSLVKIYGTAAAPQGQTPPTINGEFARNWHWGTFTFLMASGTQRGSEKWRKLNKVDLDDIYDPYPGNPYYEQRLGKR